MQTRTQMLVFTLARRGSNLALYLSRGIGHTAELTPTARGRARKSGVERLDGALSNDCAGICPCLAFCVILKRFTSENVVNY